MALRVSGKNLDIGDALRTQVETRLAMTMGKHFDGDYTGHVTVAKEGAGFRTDCVLHLNSGVTLEASGTAQDAYSSFDQTADRIETRLRRHRDRLKSRTPGQNRGDGGAQSSYTVFESPSDETTMDGDEYHPVIIAESTTTLLRLSISEALAELDLTGAPVLVFIHAGTGRVNVLYRRQDGAIGWVDSPPQA